MTISSLATDSHMNSDFTVSLIPSIHTSLNSYPAFVSIRWGFAKIENGKLAATGQWKDKEQYFLK